MPPINKCVMHSVARKLGRKSVTTGSVLGTVEGDGAGAAERDHREPQTSGEAAPDLSPTRAIVAGAGPGLSAGSICGLDRRLFCMVHKHIFIYL
jgi:hypothetical protein